MQQLWTCSKFGSACITDAFTTVGGTVGTTCRSLMQTSNKSNSSKLILSFVMCQTWSFKTLNQRISNSGVGNTPVKSFSFFLMWSKNKKTKQNSSLKQGLSQEDPLKKLIAKILKDLYIIYSMVMQRWVDINKSPERRSGEVDGNKRKKESWKVLHWPPAGKQSWMLNSQLLSGRHEPRLM